MGLDLITYLQGFLGQVLQPQQHGTEGQLVQVDPPPPPPGVRQHRPVQPHPHV